MRSSSACAGRLRRSPASRSFCSPTRTFASARAAGKAQYQYALRIGRSQPIERVGAEGHERLAQAPATQGREQRSADAWTPIQRDRGSRCGGASRHLAAVDRQHALRCLWPAAGLDDLPAVQPAPRHPRSGPDFKRIPIRWTRFTSNPPTGQQIPLSTVAKFGTGNAFLSVNHQGQFPAVTISFQSRAWCFSG